MWVCEKERVGPGVWRRWSGDDAGVEDGSGSAGGRAGAGGGGKQMLGENERCFCCEGEKVYVKTECYLISNWRNNSKRRQRGKVRGKINESGLTHTR